jgi:uncharacterized protein (TIGR00369 family)
MTETMLEMGRRVLGEQPFSVLLGVELTLFEPGKAELRVPIGRNLMQQRGFVSGGVLSYLADNAITYAAGGVLGTDVLTVEFKINFIRPALGEALIARASTVSAGRTLAVARCDLYCMNEGRETLVAAAQGTITRVERGDPK